MLEYEDLASADSLRRLIGDGGTQQHRAGASQVCRHVGQQRRLGWTADRDDAIILKLVGCIAAGGHDLEVRAADLN